MTKQERKRERDKARFARYMNRTIGNKLCAITMVTFASMVTHMTNDATALVLILMLAVPMFFAWDEWVHI